MCVSSAKMLLNFGTRPAIDQSLSRLARRGKLLRAGRECMSPRSRCGFGTHAPSPRKLIEELSVQRGETIVPSGATTANALGLTTQVPMHIVYRTSERSRNLTLGKYVMLEQLEAIPQSDLKNSISACRSFQAGC